MIVLSIGLLAHVSRLTRAAMLEVLRSRYVLMARAKGMSERRVLWRHAAPNAMLPTITILAIDFGLLIGGVVVVETVFAYPGLGRLLVFAIEHRDLPLLQAGMLVLTTIYALANLAADLRLRGAEPAHPLPRGGVSMDAVLCRPPRASPNRRRILGSRGGNSALLFGGLALAALAIAALVGLWYTPYDPDGLCRPPPPRRAQSRASVRHR